MVDECKGTYYKLEIGRYDEDFNGMPHTYTNWDIVREMSCESDECPDCHRMRLVMEVNLCDYSIHAMMADAPVDGAIYKLVYEDEYGDQHIAELIRV